MEYDLILHINYPTCYRIRLDLVLRPIHITSLIMSTDVEFIGPRPFTVDIPQSAVAQVINAARSYDIQPYLNNLLSKSIDEGDFTYGLPPVIFTRLVDRLRDGFSWPEWQSKMNAMGDHHILTVKGIDAGANLDVHFVHRRSANPSAVPLLMLHGWPSSFLEFEGIIPLLTDKYHIVCPSIPGYTFSNGPKHLDGSNGPVPFVTAQIARSYDAIMRSLGYDKYIIQGGDWGSLLAIRLAHLFPKRCKALHISIFNMGGIEQIQVDDSLSPIEKEGMLRVQESRKKDQAFIMLQGTVPYTLGAALSASPISVLAYIGEKMYRWSAPGARLPTDYIIANCLLYWFTGSFTSSFWLYYLSVSDNGAEYKSSGNKVSQPTAIGFGRDEIAWTPKRYAVQMGINVSSWNVLERGGHFLAAEAPDVLARDLDQHFSSEEVKRALKE